MNITLVPAHNLVPEWDWVPEQRAPEPTPSERKSIADWLEHFGSLSADRIAVELEDAEILGTPRDPYDCGFAVFFRRVTGQRVHVCGQCVKLYSGPNQGQSYPLPVSCRDFLQGFDNGRYPKLYRQSTPVRQRLSGPSVSFLHAGSIVHSAMQSWAIGFDPVDTVTFDAVTSANVFADKEAILTKIASTMNVPAKLLAGVS